MGLHNSGTHALVEYLRTSFHVDVQPLMAPKKDSIVCIGDFYMWKHTVPVSPLQLPSRAARGQVTLLLTVRDVQSWLVSMSRKY